MIIKNAEQNKVLTTRKFKNLEMPTIKRFEDEW